MFGFFRKKSQSADDVVAYMKQVAPFLSRDGSELQWLEEIFETDAPVKVARVFMALKSRGLSGSQAATAIELAADFCNKQERRSPVHGWPLQDSGNAGYSPRESFFVERLGEAIVAILKKRWLEAVRVALDGRKS